MNRGRCRTRVRTAEAVGRADDQVRGLRMGRGRFPAGNRTARSATCAVPVSTRVAPSRRGSSPPRRALHTPEWTPAPPRRGGLRIRSARRISGRGWGNLRMEARPSRRGGAAFGGGLPGLESRSGSGLLPCRISNVTAVLGRNLKIPHARHELPGIMVAFGRDGSANCANLPDLWCVDGWPRLCDKCPLHTTLLTIQEGVTRCGVARPNMVLTLEMWSNLLAWPGVCSSK
jgi:hypothetical protein